MLDRFIQTIGTNPDDTSLWHEVAARLEANGRTGAAQRVRLWATARVALWDCLRWDQPASTEVVAASANALPDERCRRLLIASLGWLDQRYPIPTVEFVRWPEPWTPTTVRLAQQLAALGAIDAATLEAAEAAIETARNLAVGESEVAAECDFETIGERLRSHAANALRSSIDSMGYSIRIFVGRLNGQNDEPQVAGWCAKDGVEAAGEVARHRVWTEAAQRASAAGLSDQARNGPSPASRRAESNNTTALANDAARTAQKEASSAMHALAQWPGWPELARQFAQTPP